jgi:hypothetical protein
MFDHDLARQSIGIVNRIFSRPALFSGQDHDALRYAHVADRPFAGLGFQGNADRRIGRVGKQTSLVGVNRVDQPLPREAVAFKNVESARVQGKAARVSDPESTQCPRRLLIVAVLAVVVVRTPKTYFLDVDVRLQDRHQRGLIFANGDFLFDGVFKHFAYIFAFSLGSLFAHCAGQHGGFGGHSGHLCSNLHRLSGCA